MKLRIVTDLPPVLNHTYYRTRSGVVLSSEARSYKYLVTSTIYGQGHNARKNGTYSGRITMHLSTNRRDLDSSLKLVIDGIFDGLRVNDNRLFELHLSKVIDGTDKLEVEIWDEMELAG